MEYRLCPSILSADFNRLGEQIKILEKEGLVNRRRNPENQREVLVEVTDFAREQLVTNSPQQHINVKNQMESVLTKGEREEFSRLLEKLISGLEEIKI